jgi:hypothetical protein
MHDYERDPQSGAGNCKCGAAEHHRRHPHDFRRARPSAAMLPLRTLDVCVCGQRAEAAQHLASIAASSNTREERP